MVEVGDGPVENLSLPLAAGYRSAPTEVGVRR